MQSALGWMGEGALQLKKYLNHYTVQRYRDIQEYNPTRKLPNYSPLHILKITNFSHPACLPLFPTVSAFHPFPHP